MSTSASQSITALKELPGVHFADLRRGDILLSRGICPGKKLCISDIIVKLDGGDYSHAAFFDGQHFVEATSKGVKADPPHRQSEHQKYLHVYRFHDDAGNPLDSPNLSSTPLITQAHKLLEMPYGYDELLLVAVLVCLRKTTSIPILKDLLELLGGYALTKLRELINKYIRHHDKKSIICSELIAVSFWNASNNGVPYGIPIKITGRHKLKLASFSAEQIKSYDQLVAEIESLFDQIDPKIVTDIKLQLDHQDQVSAGNADQLPLIAGSKYLPANCVSPCDLQRSPALRCIGNYLD